MPSTCTFEFDRPEPIYYSGETVNGRIQLNTTSEKSCREVYIEFNGEAKTRWEERRSRTRNGKTEYYTEYFRGQETYILSRTNVFPGGNLPPGTHAYTFSIPIPPQAPSSCVEAYGHIKYQVSLVINRAFRFDNEFHQPLTVLKALNLNMSPEYAIPLQGEDIKHFCCWPCSSGPVISNLHIPFGGYAPGQKIKYQLQIDNQSPGYDLDGIKLKFKQTYHFTAHTPRHKTRSHTVTLAETIQNETVLRLTKRLLEGELLIPPVPPSSQNTGIITVDYFVQMDIKTGDCHTDSEIIIPITIGTVPLAQTASSPDHLAWIQPTAPTPGTPGYDPDKPPSYDLIQPPSFEQATSIGDKFVDTDVDERNRGEGFIPKYPMYTNFAVPTAPPTMDNSTDRQDVPLLAPPPLGHGHASAPAEDGPSGSGSVPPYPTAGPSAPSALPYSTGGAQNPPYPPVGGAGAPTLPYPPAGGAGAGPPPNPIGFNMSPTTETDGKS